MRQSFPREVSEAIGIYVYRLVDPRSGETFYVGKGQGDRVFEHARGVLQTSTEDAIDLKTRRIQVIQAEGLQVIPIIHRHRIESDRVAYQIEAALIDAYPGLTNIAGGHGNSDYGVRHVEQIVAEYQRQDFVADRPLILIKLGKSFDEARGNIYEAARGVWRVSPERANGYGLVLASYLGVVRAAFVPTGPWIPATRANFPWLEEDEPGRWGFVGREADPETAARYVGCRVPDSLRRKGAASPLRFVDVPED